MNTSVLNAKLNNAIWHIKTNTPNNLTQNIIRDHYQAGFKISNKYFFGKKKNSTQVLTDIYIQIFNFHTLSFSILHTHTQDH